MKTSLVGKRFELTDKVSFQLISSFIFLRYFNPALLCPEAYGLTDRDLSATARRPLVLVRSPPCIEKEPLTPG